MYGAPSFYTEYEADLGQAVADPVRLTQLGNQEVWTREFERGYIVVSSMTAAPFNVTFPELVLQLPLSAQPTRLTGGREAPAWQFVVDNSPGGGPMPSGNNDWWASAAHRANFRTLQGNWTTVTDGTQSHQIGDSFLVGFSEPGGACRDDAGLPRRLFGRVVFRSPGRWAVLLGNYCGRRALVPAYQRCPSLHSNPQLQFTRPGETSARASRRWVHCIGCDRSAGWYTRRSLAAVV